MELSVTSQPVACSAPPVSGKWLICRPGEAATFATGIKPCGTIALDVLRLLRFMLQ